MLKKLSLDRRVRLIDLLTLLGILFLILISIAASVEGMNGFGNVLSLNEKTRNFWSAIEDEGKVFKTYMEEEDPQAYENLINARTRTQNAIDDLPFDYNVMSIEQYTQTNSIYHAYENYNDLQDKLLIMDTQDPDYMTEIDKFYTIQQYLEEYAGKLETLTVEQGSIAYRNQHSRYIIIPAICIIAGGIIMLIFIWFRNYSTKNYIATMEEKHQVEKQLVETHYQMLKNQINPHFLFNTLNLIASTAEIEDATTTEKMIVTLSRLFRYNLKSQTAFMPLEQELKVVCDYMYLQQMRFGQRIKYSFDAQPETLQVLVPSFVLQPLVENAIIHGISKSSKGGRIHIRCWEKDNTTWISVADTGEGMDPETYEQLKQKIESASVHNNNNNSSSGNQNHRSDSDKQGTGIGICNIAERIHGISAQSGMRIYSRPGCGTAVQIYIKS